MIEKELTKDAPFITVGAFRVVRLPFGINAPSVPASVDTSTDLPDRQQPPQTEHPQA